MSVTQNNYTQKVRLTYTFNVILYPAIQGIFHGKIEEYESLLKELILMHDVQNRGHVSSSVFKHFVIFSQNEIYF